MLAWFAYSFSLFGSFPGYNILTKYKQGKWQVVVDKITYDVQVFCGLGNPVMS